ncbi:MAG: DegV family protein [Dokdonella sp.]
MSAIAIEFPSTALSRTSGRALKRAFIAGIARVLAERDELNRINVFPVADGDTGSNLGLTLLTVRDGLQRLRSAHAGAVLQCVASEAIDGARGNSGAILAQFLQGLSETLQGSARLAAVALADAADSGAMQARMAIAEPREGTMLSVISAFAASLRRSSAAAPNDLGSAFARALAASREALADTPRQLAVLRKAGVVDAGAQGFVHLLEGINDFIARGRHARVAETASVGASLGVITLDDADCTHRWCTECVLSAFDIDRARVREALDRLGGSSLVMAGTREKLRVHMHLDDPAMLFETMAAFGDVRSQKADDMHAQQRSAQQRGGVAIVIDSAADVPAAALEQLPMHVVPVRITVGADDYLDKVSLSVAGFYKLMRNSTLPVRTSQPPAGDFRRLFEFLLSHHESIVYVGLSRGLSGTLQAGESAAAAFGDRIHIVDSANVSGGEGLLAVHAAERARDGADAATIVAELERLRDKACTFAYVRDLSTAVRGGRVPAWALPITRWLRLVPILRIGGGDGKLHLKGVTLDRADLAERFVARALVGIDRSQAWRAQVLHCNNRMHGERVLAALLAQWPQIDCSELLDAGSAIAAHAGPGAIALALMPASSTTH